MTPNDRNLIQISADSRALIRAAIKRAPGWRAYAETSDCDLGTMTTRDAIFDCCDALDIDIASVIAAWAQDGKPQPKATRRSPVAVAADRAERKPTIVGQHPRLWGPQVMTEAERAALDQARADFFRSSTPATAAKLLDAAYDAWNESHLGECDYAREVQLVNSWLLLQASTPA